MTIRRAFLSGLSSVALALLLAGPSQAAPKEGSVTGVVKFEGDKKSRAPIIMAGDPYCAEAHPAPPLNERWVFGKDDGLANVLVQVVKGPGIDGKKFTAPKETVLIDQVGCLYVPRVSVAVVGQKVQFRNSDRTLHNVHGKPSINKIFNFGQPAAGMIGDAPLTKVEEGILVNCDVHPWMTCYVHIVPHPYFAVTDGDGNFTIKDLPAGEYELKVWHEVKAFRAKEQVLKVTVKEGEDSKFNITVTPRAPSSGGR